MVLLVLETSYYYTINKTYKICFLGFLNFSFLIIIIIIIIIRYFFNLSDSCRVPDIFVQYNSDRPDKISERQLESELKAKAQEVDSLNKPWLLILTEHAQRVFKEAARESGITRGKSPRNTTTEKKQPFTSTKNTDLPEPHAIAGNTTNRQKNKQEKKGMHQKYSADSPKVSVLIVPTQKPSSPHNREKWGESPTRCNYFVAVRCSNPDVGDSVEMVLDEMDSQNPAYREACYNRDEIHITLCVLALYSQDQMDRTVKLLQNIKRTLAALAPKTPLKIEGVSEFNNCKILYAQVQSSALLEHFRYLLVGELQKEGITLGDMNRDYKPHVTIGNITRRFRTRNPGIENFPENVLTKFKNLKFGLQKVEGIYLCKMGDERREDGFYSCLTQIMF